ILVRLEDWLGRTDDLEARLENSIQDFVAALGSALGRSPRPFLVCLCPAVPGSVSSPFLARAEAQLLTELRDCRNLSWVTTADWAPFFPTRPPPERPAASETTADELFFATLATLVARKIHALSVRPGKLIVLDCDQTLWAGVCAE